MAATVHKHPNAPAEPSADTWAYGPSLRSWLGDEEPSDDDTADWLMRGMVARSVVNLFAGDAKTGKTMIAEEWAVCLASGARNWCDFPIPCRIRVLLMPREDAERTTKIRIWQIARAHGIDPRDLDGWLSIDPINPLDFGNVEHVRKLRTAMDAFDLVIVDSLTTAHHGDENSARDVSAVMGAARDLCHQTKSAILFVHHYNGKGAEGDRRSVKHRLRGSSALAGYARHIVGAARTKEKQVEISTEGNLAYQPDPFVVELEAGTRADGKRTLRYAHRGSQTDIAQAAKLARVDDAIRRAIADAGAAGLNARDLRREANAILKEDGGGVRPVMIDQRAEALRLAGDIDKSANLRFVSVSGGGSK